MANFQHFRDAQDGVFEQAVVEISRGRKEGDWMRYIFPQAGGLSVSARSVGYEIENLREAKTYLADPLLGKRLRHVCEVLLAQGERDPRRIFDELDTQKLWSSMTLFGRAEKGGVFSRVISEFFGGHEDEGTKKALLEAGMRR